MNTRERWQGTMRFDRSVPAPKWEFGYWGGAINSWYDAGLPRNNYPRVWSETTTPTATLYTKAWNYKARRTPEGLVRLYDGLPVMAGGLYWPTQGFPLDHDVRACFGMDHCQRMVDVNLLFHPVFEPEIIEEDEESMTYIDMDGVTRKFIPAEGFMPSGVDWPLRDEESWEKLKDERLNLDAIRDRFPPDWDKWLAEYKDREYPLAIGGYPHGLFGTPAHLMGYDKLFIMYYEEPELVHDILDTFTELWLAVYEEVLAQVDVDMIHFWEDISFGSGSMISPATVREFMCPRYKRIIDFLKARGVDTILVDTDGDCNELIPILMECGVTGVYPFEVHCGMDVVKVREQYPGLQIFGGIPKAEIAKGRKRIDEILEPVAKVLRTGGYVPFGDHFILPEVAWEDFKYYRERLNEMIDLAAAGKL